jgi:hypothetical protein
LNKKFIENILQEYSTTIDHLAHHVHAAHAFANGIRE